MRKTVCELFAGVGGFRIGLEAASSTWETVWFSQWEPGKKKQWAHDCYVGHFGDIDNYTGIDIAQVDKAKIPDHNLLVGGFPCQDYSVAHTLSTNHGIQGKKGVLWWEIREILDEKSPSFVLLENVDRLLKSPASQRGRDFGIILACFNQLDYDVEWRVINAADYGNGQRRRRTFIFAYKRNTLYSKSLKDKSTDSVPLIKETKLEIELSELIKENGFFAHVFPIEKNSSPAQLKMKIDAFDKGCDLASISDTFTYAFENAGIMQNGTIGTVKVFPIIDEDKFKPKPLSEFLDSDVDSEFYLTSEKLEKWKYLKGSKRIERVSKNGHPYLFSEGAIPFPDPLNRPARTMLTSESTLNRSTHVIEDPKTKRLRLLTPRESERLQGFPDDWTSVGGMPERMRYFCMGNALVVPLITAMGKYLNEIFEKEPSS